MYGHTAPTVDITRLFDGSDGSNDLSGDVEAGVEAGSCKGDVIGHLCPPTAIGGHADFTAGHVHKHDYFLQP